MGKRRLNFHTCLTWLTRYRRFVRRDFHLIVLMILLLTGSGASAATGRVVKTLPHFLDLEGRNSVSPSLYDRDAYQAQLRLHPELRSGIRFDILWRGRARTSDSSTWSATSTCAR